MAETTTKGDAMTDEAPRDQDGNRYPSASYMTALNRAMLRGDSDRVVELYAVPLEARATWTAKDDARQRRQRKGKQ